MTMPSGPACRRKPSAPALAGGARRCAPRRQTRTATATSARFSCCSQGPRLRRFSSRCPARQRLEQARPWILPWIYAADKARRPNVGRGDDSNHAHHAPGERPGVPARPPAQCSPPRSEAVPPSVHPAMAAHPARGEQPRHGARPGARRTSVLWSDFPTAEVDPSPKCAHGRWPR